MFSWVTSLTKKDPKEVVRKCRAEIRCQKRDIDKNISNLTVEQRKAERSIREAAKRNDIQSARVRLLAVIHMVFVNMHFFWSI